MNFTCDKKTLFDNINVVLKAVSSKSNVPVLEGILFKASGDSVKLFANDLKTAIEANIPAIVSEEGSAVLNAKLLFEIVGKLPEGNVSIVSDGDYKISITCMNSKFEIFGLNPADFPGVDSMQEGEKIKIDKAVLKNVIRQTIFAIGNDDKKMVLTGALFEVNRDELKVVALDGFRMAFRKASLKEDKDISLSFIVPGKTLGDLLKILDDEDTEVEIVTVGNRINFKFDNCVLYSNLISGEFFNYEHIIPSRCELSVKCETRALVDSIIRASLIITPEVKSPLKLDITSGKVYMNSASKNGTAEDTLFCETEGTDLSIGFNHKYLLDALRVVETKEVVLEFTSSLNPVLIKGPAGEGFIYIILPLRLRGE